MKKTDNYFIISNYNHDPRHLLEYCNNYTVYDQSDRAEYKDLLRGTNVVHAKHTGHNISDYFTFFIDNYDCLPEYMALIKGNIFPRHLTKEFFDRVYDNKFYTFLFERREYRSRKDRSFFLFSENEYLEYNYSWFIKEHPHWYSQGYNDLVSLVYKDPVLPRYNLYSPGACYIVSKHQILKNSRQFYKNLLKIISYTRPVNPLPSEAHQVEWLCHLIYSSNYEVHDYMNHDAEFDEALINRNGKLSCLLIDEEEVETNGKIHNENKVPRRIYHVISRYKKRDSVKLIELGVHSWKSLEAWRKILPQASVLGLGILNISQKKNDDGMIQYLNLPLENYLAGGVDQGERSDLIVYQGYHLKKDAELLGKMISSHLREKGVLIVLDVLGSPSLLMRTIMREAGRSLCLKLGCAPLRNKNLCGNFVITAERRGELFLSRAFQNSRNHVLIAYYAAYWRIMRIPEFISRLLTL